MPGRENCYDSPRCFDRKIGHFYPSFLPLPHIQPKHTHVHTYILQSTYMVFTFTRQLQCRRGAAAAATIKEKR